MVLPDECDIPLLCEGEGRLPTLLLCPLWLLPPCEPEKPLCPLVPLWLGLLAGPLPPWLGAGVPPLCEGLWL